MRSGLSIRSLKRFLPLGQPCRYSSTTASINTKPYYITTPIFYPNSGTSAPTSLLKQGIRGACSDPPPPTTPYTPPTSPFRACHADAYFNLVPHLGHLYTLVVADIFARYARIRHPGRPVNFITGTDEHGMKIAKAAEAKGMTPLAFCDMLSEHFKVCATRAQCNLELRNIGLWLASR